MSRPLGIDVHAGSGVIDYVKLAAAGYSFVYVKASEGVAPDGSFRRHVEAALAAGLRVGAYGVLTYGLGTSAEAQADAFIATAAAAGTDLPPMLDFEVPLPHEPAWPTHAATLSPRAAAWLRRVWSAWWCQPGVYSMPYYANALPSCPERDEVASYPYWAASYPVDQVHPPPDAWGPLVPRIWVASCAPVLLAQWSGDKGLPAPGCPVVVDHDIWLANALPPGPGAAYDTAPGAPLEAA